MADEYSINAKITADTSKFNKGVKNAQTSLKGFSKGLSDTINKLGKNGLVGSLANVSLAGAGLTTVFNSVIKITKNIGKAINEVTNAYKGQLMAERALDTAIQNNPYMTGESSRALKEFASEIQRVSNYGDEELLPLIANLTSLGRTQEEIMQIVRVATDMASTGTMSLDTAITQLNATLNGNLGRLGQQNAELKDLTEEELKQGKAVEILGEKFKGLSSATADTSKQLQNLKGDFKEALGQFTLPASDMWNKFWSGFYLEGINALNKFDDYLDYKVIGKKLSKNFEEYYKGLSGTREQKEFAVEDYLAIITDDELNMLELYLKSLNKLNEAQLVTINQIQYEKKHREYKKEVEQQELEIQEKQNKLKEEEEAKEVDIAKLKEEYLAKIEAQKKEWENIKAVTGEEVSTEEKIKFYQDQLLAIMRDSGGQIATNNQYFKDQMAIIKDLEDSLPTPTENVEEEVALNLEWQKKLLEQKIELLQLEKAERIALAIETGEDIEAIEEEYNQKILDAKIERIEAERREALASVSDEENKGQKIADINAYYDNEVLKAKKEAKEKKKKVNKEEEKDEKSKFAVMLGYAKAFAKDVSKVLNKMFSTIKKIVDGAFNILKKMVDFNISDTLDTILEFEDGILTFFVETLPQLPSFVESVLQSIGTLLSNLKSYIKAESISDIIYNMLTTLGKNLPTLVTDLLDILETLINGAIDGIIRWIDSGGVKTLLSLLLKIQQTLEKIVTDNIDKIAEAITSMLPDLVETLVQSIISASQTLGKIAKTLLPLIAKIITAVITAITDDRVIESSIEAIEGIVEGLIPALVELLINAIPKIINLILIKLPMYTPNLIMGIVEGLVNGFRKVDWGEALKDVWNGIVDFFSGIWDAIVDLFVDKIGGAFKKAFEEDSSTQTGTIAGDVGLGILTGGVSTLGHWLGWWANGTNNAPAGLSVVGEAGPELVKFKGGEQVINNRNTQKLLRESNGSSNTFNVNFTNVKDTSAYALVSQLKQYNRQLAINGVL